MNMIVRKAGLNKKNLISLKEINIPHNIKFYYIIQKF